MTVVQRHADLGDGGAGVGSGAVEGLVEGDREREHVGAGVDALPAELLGGHVRRRAEQRAGHRQVRVEGGRVMSGRRLAGVAKGEPEVEDPRLAVPRDEYVVGLEVAVDQTAAVRRREPARGRLIYAHDLPPAAGVLELPGPQRHAVDELHRHVDLVTERPDLVHGDDVGVAQAGERLGLAHQAGLGLAAARLGVGRTHQFDRYLAIELRIIGREHQPHAALAERPDDEVSADPRRHVGSRIGPVSPAPARPGERRLVAGRCGEGALRGEARLSRRTTREHRVLDACSSVVERRRIGGCPRTGLRRCPNGRGVVGVAHGLQDNQSGPTR